MSAAAAKRNNDLLIRGGAQVQRQEGLTGAVCGAGRRRGRGTGNPGKPGKRLRLEDLQGQFGVGLKEAANRLGICPTTLKARPPAPALGMGLCACSRCSCCEPVQGLLWVGRRVS